MAPSPPRLNTNASERRSTCQTRLARKAAGALREPLRGSLRQLVARALGPWAGDVGVHDTRSVEAGGQPSRRDGHN